MRRVEEPLKWLWAELCSTTEAVNPYSCILCKIYLTSLPLKHFHLTLYCSYCEDVRVSHFILLSHTLPFSPCCTHTYKCSQTSWVSDISVVVEGWSGKQWTKPGLKLELHCHMKITSFPNWGKTLMDTLEHITVAGHPSVPVTCDNNLHNTEWYDLAKGGNNMMSASNSMPLFWCQWVH